MKKFFVTLYFLGVLGSFAGPQMQLKNGGKYEIVLITDTHATKKTTVRQQQLSITLNVEVKVEGFKAVFSLISITADGGKNGVKFGKEVFDAAETGYKSMFPLILEKNKDNKRWVPSKTTRRGLENVLLKAFTLHIPAELEKNKTTTRPTTSIVSSSPSLSAENFESITYESDIKAAEFYTKERPPAIKKFDKVAKIVQTNVSIHSVRACVCYIHLPTHELLKSSYVQFGMSRNTMFGLSTTTMNCTITKLFSK